MLARHALTAPFDDMRWVRAPLSVDPHTERPGRHDVSRIDLGSLDSASSDVRRRAEDALFRYRIFPPHRLHARVCSADGRLAPGVTIIQRVIIGPIAVEMGVRVVEVVTTENRALSAFTYATLKGHSERGLSTFAIRDEGHGTAVFEIETWSEPGTLLSHLGQPLARLVQRRYTREALAYFREHIRSVPPR